ncbi:MAG: hypothetical protein K0R61_3563 [Microvirga sp.]|nr:hypothetical protein [Microvirga sp.]
MLSLLGACTLSLTPWGFLDASHFANETRYHESRPQSVGGTGDSGLTSTSPKDAREERAPLPDPPLEKTEEAAGTRTIRSSGEPQSRLNKTR